MRLYFSSPHNFPECSDLSLARSHREFVIALLATVLAVMSASGPPFPLHSTFSCGVIVCDQSVYASRWKLVGGVPFFLCCCFVTRGKKNQQLQWNGTKRPIEHGNDRSQLGAIRVRIPWTLTHFTATALRQRARYLLRQQGDSAHPSPPSIARVASLFGQPLPSALLTTP